MTCVDVLKMEKFSRNEGRIVMLTRLNLDRIEKRLKRRLKKILKTVKTRDNIEKNCVDKIEENIEDRKNWRQG